MGVRSREGAPGCHPEPAAKELCQLEQSWLNEILLFIHDDMVSRTCVLN